MKENYVIRLIWRVKEHNITVNTDHERPTKASAMDFAKQCYFDTNLYEMGLVCIILSHPVKGFIKRYELDINKAYRQNTSRFSYGVRHKKLQ